MEKQTKHEMKRTKKKTTWETKRKAGKNNFIKEIRAKDEAATAEQSRIVQQNKICRNKNNKKEFSIKTLWNYYAVSIEFDVWWRERFDVQCALPFGCSMCAFFSSFCSILLHLSCCCCCWFCCCCCCLIECIYFAHHRTNWNSKFAIQRPSHQIEMSVSGPFATIKDVLLVA